MSELLFYTHPQSRGRMVRRMLEECRVPYHTESVAFPDGLKTPDFRALSPLGKLPVLVCDAQVVTETAAIICFLADRFPEAALAPPPAERGAYYHWLFFAAGPLEAAVTNKALGVELTQQQQAFVGYGSFERVLESLCKGLRDSAWITGNHYTAADVYLGSHVDFGLQFGTLPEAPELLSYRERLQERPAWRRAAELDAALLAESQ